MTTRTENEADTRTGSTSARHRPGSAHRTQTRPTRPAPPARSGGGRWIFLPPWTRAPLLAFRQPAVILAVIGAAAILACAASSAQLFLSSSSSEALRRTVAANCGDASYPTVTTITPDIVDPDRTPNRATIQTAADVDKVTADVPEVMARHGLPPTSEVILSPGSGKQFAQARNGSHDDNIRLIYRDGATDNINVLQQGTGKGLYLPEDAQVALQAKPGDTISFNGVSVPVVGIYKNLYREQPVSDYWCSRSELFVTSCYGCESAPPPLAIFTDRESALTFFKDLDAASAAQGTFVRPPQFQWTSQIPTDHMTLSKGDGIVDRQQAVYDELGTDIEEQDLEAQRHARLPTMTEQVHLIRDGVAGPVVPIAIGGAILALLLVGAAGSYWADRRYREVRLLSSRGVGPGGLATKAALELTAPALVGSVLGFLLAIWLVRTIGPSPDLDSSAPRTAAITAGIGFAAGILLLSFVAGLRARNATERPVGARRSWAAIVPWEVLLLVAALLCYLRLRDTDAIVLKDRVAQVNLLLMLYPMLFLAGASILTVRLLTLLLRPLRRRSGRWPVALYLAVSRITAAPVVSVTLLAAIAMPVAMVVYSAGLTKTSEYTVDAKAKVFTGSDSSAQSVDAVPSTPDIDRIGTVVSRYQDVTIGGVETTVLAVNPATLPTFAFWDDRFADGASLDSLMGKLSAPARDGTVPAIVVKWDKSPESLSLGEQDVNLDVVAHAKVFPGLHKDQPMLVVPQQALGEVGDNVQRYNEVWSTHDSREVQRVLGEHDVRVFTTSDRDKVLDIANFVAVTWSFGYLQALAALVGLVAIGGLLLYIETRQRSRASSYAMSRRMGLSGRSHFRSMLWEMGVLVGVAAVLGTALAWIAVHTVYPKMNIDKLRPPEPLLTVPVLAVAGIAVATVVVSVLAAFYAHRSARRTDVSEVLRLG